MGARVPLDVDLEDRLLLGLSPVRFGYLALGALAAFAIWRASGLWAPLAVPLGTLPALLAAGLAWGRWKGRAADLWLADVACYAASNYRLVVRLEWPHRGLRPVAPPAAVWLIEGCEACASPGLEGLVS